MSRNVFFKSCSLLLLLAFCSASSFAQQTILDIDSPSSDMTTYSGTVVFGGWAINGASSNIYVTYQIDGGSSQSTQVAYRPDVCQALGTYPGCPNVGYDFLFDTTTLSDGTHTIVVTAVVSGSATVTESRAFATSNGVGCTESTVECEAQCAGESAAQVGIAQLSYNDCTDEADSEYSDAEAQAFAAFIQCQQGLSPADACVAAYNQVHQNLLYIRDLEYEACSEQYANDLAVAKEDVAICVTGCGLNPCSQP